MNNSSITSIFYWGNPKLASLEKCFLSVVEGRQVDLDLPVVKYLISTGFDFNLAAMNETLAEVLPYIFIYHVNQWPGWQYFGEFCAGKLPLAAWFKTFCTYLHSILVETLNTDFNEIKKMKVNLTNKATQTNNPLIKPIAPFDITIKCTASQLNTLAFSVLNDHDLELKQSVPYPWPSEETDIKTLLSWPHVGVHFSSPILEFERCIKTGFQHYLGDSKDTMIFTTENKVPEGTNVRKCSSKDAMFSWDYIQVVTSELLKALKMCYSHDIELVLTFETLFNDFVDDIKELTNQRSANKGPTSSKFLSFQFGKCTYYRNKVCPSSNNSEGIMFYEVINPTIELRLLKVGSERKAISYLESLKAGRNTVPKPTLELKCSYCQVNCGKSVRSLINHLIENHTMEPPMKCVDCKDILSVQYLAKNRWNHICT